MLTFASDAVPASQDVVIHQAVRIGALGNLLVQEVCCLREDKSYEGHLTVCCEY